MQHLFAEILPDRHAEKHEGKRDAHETKRGVVKRHIQNRRGKARGEGYSQTVEVSEANREHHDTGHDSTQRKLF